MLAFEATYGYDRRLLIVVLQCVFSADDRDTLQLSLT
jgi:hypothetical protein